MDLSPKIGFGIIGCSRIAQKSVFQAINSSSAAKIEIIGSRNTNKVLAFSRQFDCDAGAYEDVIKNKNVDVIYISLPNSLHEEWTIKALEAGKHVICEKPAAISYAAAEKMISAAKKNNVRLLEGLMFRYHPQHAKVKEMIKDGVLGDLLKFESCFSFSMPDKNSSMMQKILAGGSLNYAAVYPICASRMIFEKEPISVTCNLKIDSESGIDIKTDIFLEYADNKSAFVTSILGGYFQSTYSVLGTKANVKVNRAYAVPHDMPTKILLDANDKTEEISIDPVDHFKLMIDDFCEKIINNSNDQEMKYEKDLLAQARILEAARISNREKRIVCIPELK